MTARVSGFFGVVHLRPLPGDARYEGGGLDPVLSSAREDARALVDGGVCGFKHAAPLAPVDPAQATADAFDRDLADAVIVTGAGTGKRTDPAQLQAVRAAAGRRPVVIGSGLTPERAPALAPLADAAIVGTWLKRDGCVRAPVDRERVRRMAVALQAAWSSRAPRA